MAGWPASLDPSQSFGTIYVTPARLMRLIADGRGAGQAWRFNDQWTTYKPNTRVLYKSIDRLKPESPDDFYRIMASAQAAGASPPASFAQLFRHVYDAPWPRLSPLAPFWAYSFGGWEEAFWKGTYRGPVYQYDLNSAYRWAACQGLPDMATARPTTRYTDTALAIYLIDPVARGVTGYWRGEEGLQVVTAEEREFFQIDARCVVKGVAFDRTIDLAPMFLTVDKCFPFCYKRISRAFWGAWNTPLGSERVTWASGTKVTPLRNPSYNPIWAAFVTSRVKLRLATYRRLALHVFVDSILAKDTLPDVDPSVVGSFRLVGQYDGVWIRGPGSWGSGSRWIKHAGVPAGAIGVDARG